MTIEQSRTRYPAGVPCWVDIAEPDVDAAVEFYRGLFGWEFDETMPPGSGGHYLVARLHGKTVAAVGSVTPGLDLPPFWTTYVSVDSADEIATKVTNAGGRVLAPPMDAQDAGRMAVFADPGGAVFSVWQPRVHMGAQLVNAPNSWNWSDLNTRDIAAAERFYGAVFGWQSTPVDFGFGESRMLRVPGYGDFLEQHNPGVRQRHMEAGAPEGFTDAIGWLQLMTSDQFPDDVPPHWAVTFAVDDTDAAAERVTKFGGTVTVEPFDVPYARVAVVRDPQGAAFSISKYMPPETT